ncbi:Cysteine-rich receptor-like protein kinase [Melia azedarach]|uniref:Cysteine-rich receptor-like protein kinase n=1 Tax=Melia azedarach TaxID=155640 RepID=A0ACC1WVV8_MELAZ|nr:Cysteine-rich receptor-like protein kinase [Melia azedarach]
MATGVLSASSTILLLQLISLLSYATSQTVYVDQKMVLYCPASNTTASNKFISNLNYLFNQTLYSQAGKSLYYNATEGSFPDTAYGLYLCKYNISFQSCQKCIVTAVNAVMQKCNGTKNAIIWYEECMVRYSDDPLPIMDTSIVLCQSAVLSVYIVRNVSVPYNVTQTLAQSFEDVIAMPSLSSSSYATKETSISSLYKLHSYAQCIPVLSKEDCRACLSKSLVTVSTCFGQQQETGYGTIIRPSCTIGYELYY